MDNQPQNRTSSHPHTHSHSHSHSHDINQPTPADANRAHFDRLAGQVQAQVERPLVVQIATDIAEAITSRYPFDEDRTLVLDYACGTGLISKALAPHAHKIVGIDISQGMVDHYNIAVYNQGLTRDDMQAFCLNLQPNEPLLNGLLFDVIVCSMAYHHLEDIQQATSILASYLKPGSGTLFIADHMPYDPTLVHRHSHHPNSAVTRQGGFTEEEIRTAFQGAGLQSVQYIPNITGVEQGHKTLDIFLAFGTSPVLRQ